MKNVKILLLFIAAHFLLAACKQSSDSEISKSIEDYNDSDRKAILDIIRKAPTGRIVMLNPANDSHYRFIKKQLYMAGANEETHPQLFNKINYNRAMMTKRMEAGEAFTDNTASSEPTMGVSEITSFTASPTNDKFTTSGLLSYPFGTIQTATISIGLYTTSGGIIGTPGYATGYSASELTKLAVNSLGSTTQQDSVYSMYAFTYLDNQDSLKHGFIKAVTANVVDSIVNVAPAPCVLGQTVQACTACCPNNCIGGPYSCPIVCTNNQITTVCMTRNVPNCTYCNTGLANNLMFPLKGSIKYAGNVNVGADGKPNRGAFASVTLTRLPFGGGCPAIPLNSTFFNYVTVQGNKLSWDFPAAAFPNTCLMSGDSVLFQMTIFVTVGSGNTPAFATISNSPKVEPPALKIAPIHVVSGCLAEGTQITLSTGTKTAIENIPIHAFVKSAPDAKLRVDYTTTGTEKELSYRIKTAKNHSLLLTGAHPVITPSGVLLARDLKAGDVVLTDQGESKIIFIGREQYDGTVWNLAVSKPGEESLVTGKTTFYANGILVGDHKMQNTVLYKKETQEEILKRLPASWHTDYLNSLKKAAR